jgi:hypothetical protein
MLVSKEDILLIFDCESESIFSGLGYIRGAGGNYEVTIDPTFIHSDKLFS